VRIRWREETRNKRGRKERNKRKKERRI